MGFAIKSSFPSGVRASGRRNKNGVGWGTNEMAEGTHT